MPDAATDAAVHEIENMILLGTEDEVLELTPRAILSLIARIKQQQKEIALLRTEITRSDKTILQQAIELGAYHNRDLHHPQSQFSIDNDTEAG
jgi:hypothetical protein